jgi:hypothetical protein
VRARVLAVECLRAVFVLLDLICVYSICFDLICARRRSNQIKREIDQARRTAQARGRLRAACCLTRPSQPIYQTSRITSNISNQMDRAHRSRRRVQNSKNLRQDTNVIIQVGGPPHLIASVLAFGLILSKVVLLL